MSGASSSLPALTYRRSDSAGDEANFFTAAALPAGTYALVVDGLAGAPGTFALEVIRYPGPRQLACPAWWASSACWCRTRWCRWWTRRPH
ncbi:MAG: hypothetical protein AMXMBFR34_11550 [Myxococcaceae bacterium]